MTVRLAKASDLAATSRIAFRGFSLSPWNAFYRPFAATYPHDVEKSYLREQQEALDDQSKLFTVVEIQVGPHSAQQVVGFSIWNYVQQQDRKSETLAIDLADEKDRSVDPYRANLLFSATEIAVQKRGPSHPFEFMNPANEPCSRYLAGHTELDNMVIDPDHFRKGYGSLLCGHGMEVAQEDKIPVGIIAAKLGMKLYEYLVFSCTAKVSLTDDRPGEDASVDFWVQNWDPKDN